MSVRAVAILVFGVCLTLPNLPALASVGGVTSVGAVKMGAGGDTGSRVRIPLVRVGDLWVGYPEHPSIVSIAVYAPGGAADHLLLRELELAGGGRSVLLTAPDALAAKTRRATLYLRTRDRDLTVNEFVNGQWEPRDPQPVSISESAGVGHAPSELLAVTVLRLGEYRITPHSSSPSTLVIAPKEPSARYVLGGGLSRGLLPVLWAVILLGVCWAASLWAHGSPRAGDP